MTVLTCTHNLLFEQKYEKYLRFLCENFKFFKVIFSICLHWRVFVMTGRIYLRLPRNQSFVFFFFFFFFMRTTNTQIRLRRCAGWFEFPFGVDVRRTCSHVVAQWFEFSFGVDVRTTVFSRCSSVIWVSVWRRCQNVHVLVNLVILWSFRENVLNIAR